MNKEIILEKIFERNYSGIINGIHFEDLPKDLKNGDIIDIEKVEAFYSENDSWDAHSILFVYRKRLETDEEFKNRKEFWKQKKEESRKLRYEQYLKLKKEFESNEINS